MQHPQPQPGLEAVIRRGARRRHNPVLDTLLDTLLWACLGSMSAALIYIIVLVLAGRTDWPNILLVAGAAALIPMVAVSLLIVGARRTHPFSVSLAVLVFAASLVIAWVSALRIPISYLGLVFTLPSSLLFVCLANLAMVKRISRDVVLLDFPGAEAVASRLKWPLPVVTVDEVDMRSRRVLIDPVAHHTPEWAPRLAQLYLRGIAIEAWPSYVEGEQGRVDLSSFDLAHISYSPAQIIYYRLKRVIDLVGVVVLALPVSIVCALVWLYIRIIDGGPSIFVQDRRGYAGSTFRLYKFRTMYEGSNSESAAIKDARVMPGCVVLRQLRIDELPQLLNILKGDMSFIGPRPVALNVAVALEARNPLYVNRSILVPGLTGWAQVAHGYAQTADEEIEKLSYDLYYLKHVSMDLDIIIIFRTIQAVIFRIGSR